MGFKRPLSLVHGQINSNCLEYVDEKGWVIASYGTNINIYNTNQDCKLIKSIQDCGSEVLCFCLKKKTFLELIVVDVDGNIFFYNFSDDFQLYKQERLSQTKISNGNFSPDGSLFVYKSDENFQIVDLNLDKKSFIKIQSNQPAQLEKSIYTRSLQISRDNRYFVDVINKNIFCYDLFELILTKNIKSQHKISALAIHPLNQQLVVGHQNGAMTFYYNPFDNDKTQMSQVHWHSQEVLSLSFNNESSVLFSGGKEGVLVYWHLIENKQDYCPRLGSDIVSIKPSEDDQLVMLTMRDNSVRLLRVGNFIQFRQIKGITNPSLFSQQQFWNTINPKNGNMVTQSLQGRIQFFDPQNQRKTNELAVIYKNYSGNSGSDVCGVSFNQVGDKFATFVQRTSEMNTMSSLIFYEEISSNYRVNSQIDYPHGHQIYGCLFFLINGEERCVSWGSDNRFKIWKSFAKKQQDRMASQIKLSLNQLRFLYYAFVNFQTIDGEENGFEWGCEFEDSYKGFEILDIAYIVAKQQLVISCSQQIVFWDAVNFEFLDSAQIFKSDDTWNKIQLINDHMIIAQKKAISVYDLKQNCITYSQKFESINDILVDDKNLYVLVSMEFNNKQISCLVEYKLHDHIQLTSINIINSSLMKIQFHQSKEKRVLLGITNQFSFLVLKIMQSIKQIYDQQIEIEQEQRQEQYLKNIEKNKTIFNLQTHVNLKESQDSKFDIEFDKMRMPYKETKKDIQKELFDDNSHLIPTLSLIYKQYINQFQLPLKLEQLNINSQFDSEILFKKNQFQNQTISQQNKSQQKDDTREFIKQLYRKN